MSELLQGKVCLVTGAGRGIGQAVAHRMAEEGAFVYANIRRPGAVEAWAKELPAEIRSRITPLLFDVTDQKSVLQAITRIRRDQNRIDVLVNNAGVAYNERLGMISQDKVRSMFEVNVYSVLELTQLVARIMVRQNGGSIINIASIVGVHGDAGQVAYAASKGAVIALTKSAAKELAGSQIRVNAIAPGLTETDLYRETDASFLSGRITQIGMKRVGQPDDIANACVFLASDLSSYLSGQVMSVDGCSIL